MKRRRSRLLERRATRLIESLLESHFDRVLTVLRLRPRLRDRARALRAKRCPAPRPASSSRGTNDASPPAMAGYGNAISASRTCDTGWSTGGRSSSSSRITKAGADGFFSSSAICKQSKTWGTVGYGLGTMATLHVPAENVLDPETFQAAFDDAVEYMKTLHPGLPAHAIAARETGLQRKDEWLRIAIQANRSE